MILPPVSPRLPDRPQPDNVGLALSGGGVRALLFGLGALRAVIAAREQIPGAKLSLLVGVSGGALGAAFAASRIDLSTATVAEYDARVLRPAAWTIVHRSMMFARWNVWAVLSGALGVVGGGAVVALCAPLPWPLRIGAFVAGIAAAAPVASRRGAAIERSIRETLFGGDKPISEVDGGTHLVLQTTDLTSGEATYLTSRGITSWRWGDAPSGDLSLVHAARAAATFPVVFGPWRMKCPPFVREPDEDDEDVTSPPKTLTLVDGGVYDNMGSEWLIRRAGPGICKVVVNASQNLPPHDSIYGIPLIGDVLSFIRERDIQYDATTAPRRRLLYETEAHSSGGATIAIEKDIRKWAAKFVGKGDEMSGRAEALVRGMDLAAEPGIWARWAKENPAVGTSLGKLPLQTARDLVCAGYLATAVQMHILRVWPAPEHLDPNQLMPWLGTER